MFFSVRICFCKHKTAYEMRISDWSSDVCSSDLAALDVEAEMDRLALAQQQGVERARIERQQRRAGEDEGRRQRQTVPGDAAEAAEQPVVQVAKLLVVAEEDHEAEDRKSTRLNSSH